MQKMLGVVYLLTFLCAICLGAVTHKKDGPLILTPYIENGETVKAKHLSVVDPSLFAGVYSHAGYFNVNKTGKWNLFFWYFPAEGVPLEATPLIIWLQGGPGASFSYGLFEEIGPIKINSNLTAERMPITWGSNYSLLFIDNPVGVGFSFSEGGEYTHNEDEVGASLLSFIQQFLEVFPEVRKAPLFIAGESYAGKYIPTFGHYIHHQKKGSKPINLKGLAIGDGWTDPPTLLHYSEFALQVGLIDPEQAQVIHKLEQEARDFWDKGDIDEYTMRAQMAFYLLNDYAPIGNYNYLNNYTVIPEYFVDFLNSSEVQSALHVKKMDYNMLSFEVHYEMSDDMYRTVKPWLEELLEHYGVMCYSGQLDVIVAYALSVHTYRSLKWSGAQAYRDAERVPLYDEEHKHRVNSFVKASGNFMDVMVRGAGHMVPADKPRAAKQIIDMFINKFK